MRAVWVGGLIDFWSGMAWQGEPRCGEVRPGEVGRGWVWLGVVSMKLRLRVVDEYSEPLKSEQFYVTLYRTRDQRRETPILRKAVLEVQIEQSVPGPWGTMTTRNAWEPIEITTEDA
jgi:hypothetical protein